MTGESVRALGRFAHGCDELGLNVRVVVERKEIDARFAGNGSSGNGGAPASCPASAPGQAVAQGMSPATLHPGYRRAIVLGSAGTRFWRRFLEWRQDLGDVHADPLDRFTQLNIESLVAELHAADAGAVAAYPFREPRQIVPFAALVGDQPWAGIAPFGVAVHPQAGPWFAWRAVVLTELAAPPTPPQASPCLGCAAPCAEACPVQAVSKAGFRWQACVDFRVSRNRCRDQCLARIACPVAPELRYGMDQMAFHYRASLRMLQARANGG